MSVGHDQGFHVIKSQGHRSKLKVNAVCNAVGLTSIINREQFFSSFRLLLAGLHIVQEGQTSNGRWRLSSSSVTLHGGATQLTRGQHSMAGQSCYVPLVRHLVSVIFNGIPTT